MLTCNQIDSHFDHACGTPGRNESSHPLGSDLFQDNAAYFSRLAAPSFQPLGALQLCRRKYFM
jgi:hypothetical protein